MLLFLRAYLYWTILWGYLVVLQPSWRTVLPSALLGIDALMVVVCFAFVIAKGMRVARVASQARTVFVFLAVLLGYGLTITALQGGSAAEALKYLGVLARPLILLLAIHTYAQTIRGAVPQQRRIARALRLDLALLTAAQMVAATIQLVTPEVGQSFIPAFSQTQSGLAALAEGDVSGTFPNSIELAYFLVASYVALTADSWARRRMPPLLLTLVIVFFTYSTGSVAATVCLGLYATLLHARCFTRGSRIAVSIALLPCLGAMFASQADMLIGLVNGKIDNMMLSRLGLIFVSVPGIIQADPTRLVLGLGADFTVIESIIKRLPDVPLIFTYDDISSVINDVFWVAMVLSVGLPMVIYYLVCLSRLFRRYLRTGANDAAWAAPMFKVLVSLVFLAGFLNQILAIRSFTATLLIGLIPFALRSRFSGYIPSSVSPREADLSHPTTEGDLSERGGPQ